MKRTSGWHQKQVAGWERLSLVKLARMIAAQAAKMDPELESLVLKTNNEIVSGAGYDYDIGEAWNGLKRMGKKLRAAGATSREDFWNRYILHRVDAHQARRLGRLVDQFDRVAFAFSLAMLENLVKYCDRAAIELWRDPREQLIHVPRPGAAFEDLPLMKCSPEELKAALDALPPKAGNKGRPVIKVPAIAHRIVIETTNRIEAVIGAGATFSVRMAKDLDVYSLSSVPRAMVRQACQGWLAAMDAAGA